MQTVHGSATVRACGVPPKVGATACSNPLAPRLATNRPLTSSTFLPRVYSRRSRSGPCKVLEHPLQQDVTEQKSQEEAFSWTKNWYVVGVEDDLEKDRPHLVHVLGGQFVLWCSNGQWHCQKDECPHRLAPLSEGKIVGDSIQCSYHGWRFGPDGTCVHIPQAPAEQEQKICSHPRSKVASFPTRVQHGLVWVWPDSGEARYIEAAAKAVAQDVPPQGAEWQEFLPLYLREFPYTYQTLFDNALDPSHVPWSHHGVIGDRTKVEPLQMRTVQDVSPKGVTVRYTTGDLQAGASSAKGTGSVVTTDLSFKAPHTLVYDLKRDDGSEGKLMAYVTPTEPGRCKVYSISLDTRRNFQNYFTRVLLPRWTAHMTFMIAGDGDIVLLKTQEDIVPKRKEGWKAFFMPTKADTCVSLWRRWLEKFTDGEKGHPYMLAPDDAPAPTAAGLGKEQLLDRFNQHTKHCRKCSSAMNQFKALSVAATAVAVVAAQLALLAAVGIWNVSQGAAFIPPSGLQLGWGARTFVSVPAKWAVVALTTAVAAMAAKLARGFADLKQKFIFEDYVHAYI